MIDKVANNPENFKEWINKPTPFKRNIYRYGQYGGLRVSWLEFTWPVRLWVANLWR
jgi:hypothetical protein